MMNSFLAAHSAGAQDLSDLKPFSSVKLSADSDVTVSETKGYTEPDYTLGTYHAAFLTCASVLGVETHIDVTGRSSSDFLKAWMAETRNGAGATPYILGQDGIAYDMNVQQNFERFAKGEIQAGLKKSSPEFKRALHDISQKCGLQF